MRLIRLIRLFAASVGPLRHEGVVPGDDLVSPAAMVRPSWRTSGGHDSVLEVAAELVDELGGEGGVGEVVDDLTTSLACQASPHLTRGSPAASSPSSFVLAVDVDDTFFGHDEQSRAR